MVRDDANKALMCDHKACWYPGGDNGSRQLNSLIAGSMTKVAKHAKRRSLHVLRCCTLSTMLVQIVLLLAERLVNATLSEVCCMHVVMEANFSFWLQSATIIIVFSSLIWRHF